MSSIVIKASKRQPGRKEAKEGRRQGLVPGVYYAKNQDPVHFTVPTLVIRPVIFTSEAKLVRLTVGEDGALDCILKDVTFDPVTDAIVHVDFHGVSAGEKIVVDIPVHLVGNAEGIKFGGLLEHNMHKLSVRVDPHSMPEHINVDVTDLKVGMSIHVSELVLPGLELLDRPETVVVACVAPKVATETTVEPVEGTPEV